MRITISITMLHLTFFFDLSSIFKFEDEIMMLHATIRKSGILLNPCSETIINAVDGFQLNLDSINFYITAKENFHSYIKIGADSEPVFITCEDEKLYSDVSNWNIPKLSEIFRRGRCNVFNSFMTEAVII